MTAKNLLPENISISQFKELLKQYPALIESISATKGSKLGQKSLAALDKFRYDEAISIFSSQTPKRAINHDDVKTLVEWKLRHGTFRPTLMKLVSSNDEKTVNDTIEKAMKTYWTKPDAAKALDGISKLKGIGPATASLLLSVHDPTRVIFFSDEAFYWLCCGGKKSAIKYNAKEYQELNSSAEKLVKRLGVSATDVEKVAYVVVRQAGVSTNAKEGNSKGEEEEPAPAVKPLEEVSEKYVAKRKETARDEAEEARPVRRSKRGKPS
ncbi:uncharacterized protein BCR38DRAFT_423857 [Pseudomassariella vexata]|uniref:Uncharacterized protein n=1 Tax=Pseudomassariella vexata TaxID=1141098 RepID=A0A1Y2EBC5_9PEZI|nr:uncharacterized protein BCR38DRAFT_423857 [Pseudomassariella vexata]ORY68604.1 hypothetical protein BCR38DRAFT_423857 [Pseudomassariella vexata]